MQISDVPREDRHYENVARKWRKLFSSVHDFHSVYFSKLIETDTRTDLVKVPVLFKSKINSVEYTFLQSI